MFHAIQYSHNFPVPLHTGPDLSRFGREELFPTAGTVFCNFLQVCQGLLLSGLCRLLARRFVTLLGFVFLLSCFSLSSCCHVTRWLGDVSLVVPSQSRRDSSVSSCFDLLHVCLLLICCCQAGLGVAKWSLATYGLCTCSPGLDLRLFRVIFYACVW